MSDKPVLNKTNLPYIDGFSTVLDVMPCEFLALLGTLRKKNILSIEELQATVAASSDIKERQHEINLELSRIMCKIASVKGGVYTEFLKLTGLEKTCNEVTLETLINQLKDITIEVDQIVGAEGGLASHIQQEARILIEEMTKSMDKEEPEVAKIVNELKNQSFSEEDKKIN